ncbi:unnamed protein product [Lactuca saligna]|uniref:NB-ARC domain-containing protein n=1 Tax=Lactuca saligna TaxID=75948 RepID=A0AA35VVK4_LACSI|nr:unnamed protein product [Lactuca saligna]
MPLLPLISFWPEAEFIKEIVKDIYSRLCISSRIPVPQLFGIDDSINSLTSWLNDESSHTADIYTIWGIAGIGKTSLAKYVYWLHSHEFDTSSFIGDISRRCNSFNGLLDLQKQLFDDIFKPNSIQVHEVSLYIPMIENALASKKVFLVLDDIDNLDQLNALLGSKGFQAGSKIIITTKNKWLTKSCELFKRSVKPKNTKHFLQGLNTNESRRLLCFHAFMSNDPMTGYEEVLEKLVMYCDGHPLALEILGRSLHKRDVAYWEGHLETLKKENGSPVNNILRISFDSLLSENDKDLFKHIACFFVGVDKYFTEAILKACNINTSFGFTNLFDRCLLSIEENNILMMHQLLQEMGRYVVREESPNKPWMRSRLWCHEESFEVLKQQKGTENVLGLGLDMRLLKKEKSCGSIELKTDALSNMVNLILLQLNDVQMKGTYKKFPEKIRWLCIHGFPLKSIPSDLPMDNLVALDLSYSKFESFDIYCSNPKRPRKRQKLIGSHSKEIRLLRSLKFLNLSFCEKLCSLDCFDGLPALEWLIVTNCVGLLEISESIQQCVELVHINLSYCIKLGKLPRTICMLKKVKTLLLEGCRIGPQIEVMDMDSLVNKIGINAETFFSAIMNSIPTDSKFFTNLPLSLVKLWLGNNNLTTKSFPMDFSCLSVLKELCLDDNPISSMPNCVRSLPRLELLHMAGCSMLTSVEYPPPTLRYLNLLSIDGWLQKVVFDPEMSPLRLGMLGQQIVIPCDIQGIVKIERMTAVEEKLLDSLGWTNPDFPYEKCMETFFADKKPEESKNKMCYEFGIFTTHYMGKEQPNWITKRSKGPSISFTIPSPPFNLRGLNLCFVEMLQDLFSPDVSVVCTSPTIKINNTTKNLTWIYTTSLNEFQVDGECLILLSHWMFGINEMEPGDHVTITGKVDIGSRKECGLTTGEYILDFGGYERDDIAIDNSLYEFVGNGAVYKEPNTFSYFVPYLRGDFLIKINQFLQEQDNGFVKEGKNTIVGDNSSGISFKSDDEGSIGKEENSHGCKDNLPPFNLSVLQYLDCLLEGPDGEQLFSFPLKKMRDLDNILQLGSSDEQDDAEVDYMKSS